MSIWRRTTTDTRRITRAGGHRPRFWIQSPSTRSAPADGLHRLYTWDPLLSFIADVLNKKHYYRMADPLAAVTVNVMHQGQNHGWHFDEAEVTTTLMLQAPEEGGAFEYAPNVRPEDRGSYEIVDRVLRGRYPDIRTLKVEPGTLILFVGYHSMHQVTRVKGKVTRYVAAFLLQGPAGRLQQPRGAEAVLRANGLTEAGSPNTVVFWIATGGGPLHAVIIGNGVTGVTAATRLRQLQPDWKITLVSGESAYHYSRPALMYIFMGHMSYEATKPFEDRFWRDYRLDLLRDWVTGIDIDNKHLVLHGNGPLPYDRLLIATGAKSNKFGWPGQDLEGVQGLYNLKDLRQLYRNVERAKRAVIVGGGLIGIELAEMLHSRHIDVTFLIREASYWCNILPIEESGMIKPVDRGAGHRSDHGD